MQHYQQLDLQTLIDLLADETQEYTQAFARGAMEEIAIRKTVMDALISEIKSRQKDQVLPKNVLSAINPSDQSEAG